MLTDQELQSLRNLGNEAEAAANEIERLRAALAALPRTFRTALLEEAAQWTGDYRVPVHRGLCDAAKRARVPLTMDECYLAAKRA